MEGPFSPLGIASRALFRQEVKSALTEDVGTAVMLAFTVVSAIFLGCVAYKAGYALVELLNEHEKKREDGCGCSR